MNRLAYRIVFNTARGCLMAVAETATSKGQSTCGERVSGIPKGPTQIPHTLTNLALACKHIVQTALVGVTAVFAAPLLGQAQTVATRIVADPSAPSAQRPTVLNTSNGVVQVDIRTPSAAGVSRNAYSQFDVGNQGAILNNSRTNVQSQLGGWVQGNPWLATGSARVILNEVNSSNPSYLQGYVEVAGQRAEVVIANPAGIAVNGGGFINASGVTLTTGTPVMSNGNLDSYRVQTGNVKVDGLGMDTRGADYTAILARAAQINAGVWANDLSVVTGANEVKVASLGAGNSPQASPISGAGVAPAFALDVATLGGMYAGKIQLVGTESGLGVNHAGVMAATSGNLSLSNSGWLTNTGSMQAAEQLDIRTQGAGVNNTGVLYAQGNTTVRTDNAVLNSGTLAANGHTLIEAQSLSSTAKGLLGAGVQADGRLTSGGDLTVTTSQALVANGQNLAAGRMVLAGAQVDLASSQTAAGQVDITATQGAVKTAHATVGTLSDTGALTITANAHAEQNLDNTAGALHAGQIQIQVANRLDNTQGKIEQTRSGTLQVQAGTLDNTQGLLQASQGSLNMALASLNNATGTVYAAGDLQANVAQSVVNTGVIAAQGQVSLNSESLNAGTASVLAAGMGADGRLSGQADLLVNTRQALVANGQNLASGRLSMQGASVDLSHSQTGADTINVTALTGQLNTASATVVGTKNLALTANQGTAQNLDNTGGALSAQNLSVDIGGTLLNGQGTLYAQGPMHIHAATLNNDGGQIKAVSDLTVVASDSITNRSGKLYAGNDLSLGSPSLDNTSGSIGSGRDLGIQTTSWRNASTGTAYGTVSAGRDLNMATTGDQNINTAAFAANRHLTFATTGQMNVSSTLQASGDMNLNAAQLSNSGKILAGATLAITATSDAGSITNSGDMVGASVVLKAPVSITNTGPNAFVGASDAGGKLVLLSRSITNADEVTNTDTQPSTTIYGAGQVVLAGGTNADGSYSRANQILNRSALIESGGDMTLAANTITNTRRVLAMGSTFDQPVSAVDLAALGVSLSGTTRSVSADSIGGVYIDPPHGGSMNSDYLHSNYTGTATQNAVQSISPTARMVAGGQLNIQAGTLQNYWSQVAAMGNINMPGVTLDQDSWRGAPTPQIKVAYSGSYIYRTYRGTIWSHSFCDTGCDAPGTNLYYTRSLYDASFSANGNITGSGVTLHNGASAVNVDANTALGGTNTPQPRAFTAPAPLAANVVFPGIMTVPNNGLYKPTTKPGAHYLIETDPRFVNRDQWLSSDYLLGALGKDPNAAQKRLGDASYEQKLIREQVAQLTGRSFLGDYTSTQDEYMALMNSAVTVARQFNLRPGVALTAEQVAQLTTDMVWLVSQDVVLPDGSRQSVLVPQVYLSAATRMNVRRDGALVAANSIDLQDLKGFANGGTVAAKQNLNLQTEGDLSTAGGSLVAGRQMSLRAGGNIDLASATLQAGALDLNAGKNLNLQTLTATRTTATPAGSGSLTSLGRQTQVNVAGNTAITTGGDLNQQGAKLNVGGDLQVQTGGDWNIGAVQSNETKTVNRFGGAASSNFTQNTGSSVSVGGNTQADVAGDLNVAGSRLNLGSNASNKANLTVGGNVNLSAVKDTAQVDSSWSTRSGNSASSGSLHRYDETVQGTSLGGGGGVNLTAGQDVNIQGSQIDTGGATRINAGGSVNVSAVAERHENLQTHQGSRSGVVSASASAERHESESTVQVGALLGARTIDIQAGKDIAVTGSSVVSDSGTTLQAGRNVSIEAAQNTAGRSDYREESSSGLMGSGGLGVTVGNRSQSQDQQNQSTTAAASTVGALSGNVSITAGKRYTQTGSDVLTPKGDIDITAKTVTINEARETRSQSSEQKFSQSGVTLAVTSTVLSTLQAADKQIQAAGNTSSSRMQALAVANVAMNARQAADAVQKGQDGNAADQAGGISASLTVGTSSSRSTQTSSADTAQGSHVSAGGNIKIAATGAGQASNLTVQGSDVKAVGTTSLKADNQVSLLAASNTTQESSSDTSSSASAGISASLGRNTGLGLVASASAGKGSGAGNSTSYTNSHVEGGQQVQIESGGDTTLKGAMVSGNQVTAKVGGNLNIESLQDKSQYDAKSQSAGGSVFVGLGSNGPVSGNLSLGQTKINSTYTSVGEQSAIRAGDGGFDVGVAGKTELKGGQITSTQAAIDNNKNSYEAKQGTTTSDLQNSAHYDASSVSVNLGTGSSQPGQSLSANLTGVGLGSDKGSANSTTTAGISGVAGNTAARTGDASTSLKPIFDADKVKKEIEAQVTITSEFNKQAGQAINSYVNTQRKALQDQLKNATTDEEKTQAAQAIKDVNMQERALNILTSAFTGMVGATVSKEALSTAAEKMRDLMIEDSKKFAGVVDSTGKVLSNVSGPSEGLRGGGVKVGGTRVDPDLLCGPDNSRCAKNADGSLALNQNKEIQFIGKDAAGNSMTIEQFLATPEGQKMSGLTGGVQGMAGTLFGIEYKAGSWQDKLVEAFAGSHDFIGGKLSGLYDDQGNIKRGMTDTERAIYDKGITIGAIPLAAPFAAAEGISPEVWKAIGILLGAGK